MLYYCDVPYSFGDRHEKVSMHDLMPRSTVTPDPAIISAPPVSGPETITPESMRRLWISLIGAISPETCHIAPDGSGWLGAIKVLSAPTS